MEKLWNTAISCQTLAQADLAAARLDAAGIPALIRNEFTILNDPFLGAIEGGIHVQVEEKNLEIARELIAG